MDFDFHGLYQKQTRILFQKQELKNYSFSETKHLNLRVLKGEKAGTSYTKDFSKASLEDCYKRAVDSLKFSDKKERGELSEKEEYKDFSNFYNEDFKKTDLEDKIQKAQEMNRACLDFDKRVQPVYSSVSDLDNFNFFANSKEVQSFYKSNEVFAHCSSLAVQKDSRSNGFSEKSSRSYQDIDFQKIGFESASKALKKLNYSIPKTKKYPVVFRAGQAVGSLLPRLAALMSGKSVFKALSLFKDSLKKKFFQSSFFFMMTLLFCGAFTLSLLMGRALPWKKPLWLKRGFWKII